MRSFDLQIVTQLTELASTRSDMARLEEYVEVAKRHLSDAWFASLAVEDECN